ncbi:hypothetical protein GLIP_2916 [Aliiglaciecola lipolytica E3]|uniref:Uncharacterized protein n=1 Tax=Aliiglaciecola lipolytica E3 TaxID=1127673 RepID=K6YBH1_9ALTE|nr:hypothetical protein GLIP_2916 [Aliiglaciecola lipolytica E3]
MTQSLIGREVYHSIKNGDREHKKRLSKKSLAFFSELGSS